MRIPKLFNVVLATTLMFANVTCACAPFAPVEGAAMHEHGAMQAAAEHAPGHHQACEGCDELLDSCATPEYTLIPSDRDSRFATTPQAELDEPEFALAFIDTGQPRAPPLTLAPSGRDAPAHRRPADTPIRRKDQLTE